MGVGSGSDKEIETMTFQRMHCFLLLSLGLLVCSSLAGCENNASDRNELAAKSGYSVLQSYEYRFRKSDHTQSYIVEDNALGSGFDVIGLPISGKDEGYVWLIAQPAGRDSVLILPEGEGFTVDESTARSLEGLVKMSPATAALIRKASNSPK